MGPRAPQPRSPHSWERGQAFFLWQPGSKTQARMSLRPPFKAIQLHQCTETALFDLNMKFYSTPNPFLLRRAREGRVVLNVHFFRSYFPCGFFHFKEYSPTMGTKVHLQQINHAPRPGVHLWGPPVSNHDGHEARKAMNPTLDFLRCCPLDAHQRAFTAAHSHSPRSESHASRRQSS